MPREPQNLIAAREYARLGWRVFPLLPKSKAPLTTRGFYDATVDPRQLDEWWLMNPNAGVGIATGMVSKLVVVDIDPRNGGHESLQFLEEKYGTLPKTVESRTGGGGRHLFFYLDLKSVFPGAKPWSGIDVKADGGYICAPWSVHPSGLVYHWRDDCDPSTPLAHLPDWLLGALQDRKDKAVSAVSTATSTTTETVIPEGGRDDALTSLAGTMQRRGMAYESILRAILAENEARCRPPLPEPDVLRIVQSVSRYVPDPDMDPGVSKAAAEGRSIQFLDVFGLSKPEPIPWLLEAQIAFGDCSLIVGPPASGKSWLTYEIAVAGSMGLPILGRYTHEGGLRVLLVDEENSRDEVIRRLWLLTQAWKVNPKDLSQQLLVTRPCQGWSFRDRSAVYALHQQIQDFKPDVVIFDSLIAVSTVLNEADSVQVRRFFHDMVYPLRDICNSTMIFVHHTNKGAYLYDRAMALPGLVRGSIDFVAAVDSAVMVESRKKKGTDKTVHRMESIKVRRGAVPLPSHFELVGGYEGGLRPILREIQSEEPQNQSNDIKEFVLMLLQDGSSQTPAWIRKWVQMQIPTAQDQIIRNVLSRMLSEGLVCVEKENGDKHKTVYRKAGGFHVETPGNPDEKTPIED